MKRTQFFGLGTLAGVAGTVFLASGASGVGSVGALNASGINPPQGTGPVKVATATPKVVTTKTRTVTGQSVFVNFGYVQVKVTAKGKRIVDIQAVKTPNGDGRSVMIAQYSIPVLRQQALTAQSAHISGVSGASYTSYGFKQSLQSALTKLGI